MTTRLTPGAVAKRRFDSGGGVLRDNCNPRADAEQLRREATEVEQLSKALLVHEDWSESASGELAAAAERLRALARAQEGREQPYTGTEGKR